MRKLIFFASLIFLLSGCVGISKFAYHTIDVKYTESDYKVVKTVTGEATATYIFGIGGMSAGAQQLFDSSFQNMVSRAKLSEDQMIVNIIAESKWRNWLGVVVEHTVYTKGIVVEGVKKNASPMDVNHPKGCSVGDKIVYNGVNAIVVKVKENGSPLWLMTNDEAYVSWADEFNKSHEKIGAINSSNGKANFVVVVKCQNWQNKYPAFAWCAEFGSGWYIPSKEEMEAIVATRVLGKVEECYLTSTEIDGAKCYAVLNGAQPLSKYKRANVRAMCRLE